MCSARRDCLVPRRSPWNRIEAIKPLYVNDPNTMENASVGTFPLSPPLYIVCAHVIPAIERDTPVLSPFLREWVVLEVRFGRRATEPVQDEFILAGENVGAAITDTEWNIAH